MNRSQARTLLLISARRAGTAGDGEALLYTAETTVKLAEVERLGRALRGRLADVGATSSPVLSLLSVAGHAGETLDFEALARVSETVVLREQIRRLRYDVQCRLAYLAGKYGTPTREASARPPRPPGASRTRKPARRPR